MTGPEGQIFGPMADTYAFALGGALLLALTVSPVLCCLLFCATSTKAGQFLRSERSVGLTSGSSALLRMRWLVLRYRLPPCWS